MGRSFFPTIHHVCECRTPAPHDIYNKFGSFDHGMAKFKAFRGVIESEYPSPWELTNLGETQWWVDEGSWENRGDYRGVEVIGKPIGGRESIEVVGTSRRPNVNAETQTDMQTNVNAETQTDIQTIEDMEDELDDEYERAMMSSIFTSEDAAALKRFAEEGSTFPQKERTPPRALPRQEAAGSSIPPEVPQEQATPRANLERTQEAAGPSSPPEEERESSPENVSPTASRGSSARTDYDLPFTVPNVGKTYLEITPRKLRQTITDKDSVVNLDENKAREEAERLGFTGETPGEDYKLQQLQELIYSLRSERGRRQTVKSIESALQVLDKFQNAALKELNRRRRARE